MTSEELTPAELRRLADGLVVSYHVVPSMSSPSVDAMRAAADLIDAQQARIEELEAALEFHGVVQKCAKCLEVLHRDVLLAASPDTPETRPPDRLGLRKGQTVGRGNPRQVPPADPEEGR